MKTIKRTICLLLVLATVCSICAGSVSAASEISGSAVTTTADPVTGCFVRIRYSVNGRYLDVPAEGITKDGTQLQIWEHAPGNTNQIFQMIDTGKGWQIISLQSGKVIEVRNSSHDDCAQVAQWSKHDLACARWDIVKHSDGSVSFLNRESGKYLNVHGGGNAGNGTKMIQYHDDKSPAMRFFIEPVTISGYTAVTSAIPSSQIKKEKDLSFRTWHPLDGLTKTMMGQEAIPKELEIDLPANVEAFNTKVDVFGFALSWLSNSSNFTRIHVTEGTNGQISIRYGTSIEQIRSGKTITYAQMLTEAHPGEASYVLWAASDADKSIRSLFGLTGNGRYSMTMHFGKVKYGDYGYAIVIEDGAVRQVPLIHPDSTYEVYYKENKKNTYVLDAADILRKVRLPMADEEARTLMLQLIANKYVDAIKIVHDAPSGNQTAGSAHQENSKHDFFPKCAASYTSIVNALKSIGADSSYAYRKQIAAANGISGYSGTAAQNTQMLSLLKSGALKKPGSSTSSAPAVSCFPRYTGSSSSLVTGLNAVGANSSYAYRKQIAAANGISGYSGTAAQNTQMLNWLKSGTLKKP